MRGFPVTAAEFWAAWHTAALRHPAPGFAMWPHGRAVEHVTLESDAPGDVVARVAGVWVPFHGWEGAPCHCGR